MISPVNNRITLSQCVLCCVATSDADVVVVVVRVRDKNLFEMIESHQTGCNRESCCH